MHDVKHIAYIIMKWGSLVLGLLILAALGAYISIKISVIGTELSVPDVTNVTVQDAYKMLANKGLFLEVEGERNDDRVAEGKILLQDPPAGSKIRKGRKVKVMLSLGARKIHIPELYGETERSARIKVTLEGMVIGSVSHVSNDLEAGRVIAQSPAPGSEKLKGGSVNLLVSRGQDKHVYIMPDIVDRFYEEVEPIFASHGIRVSVAKRERSGFSKRGKIVSQHPVPGYPIPKGSVISITILE